MVQGLISNDRVAVSGRVCLSGGRHLGYAQYGDPKGRPVLFFPGMPGSRFVHPPEGATRGLGVRLLVIERPGFGLSDSSPGRTLLDWPSDVMAFADALQIDRFPVVGLSAGGPYVAACALCIPGRLTGAAIVSGVGPMDAPGSLRHMPLVRRAGAMVAVRAPWLVRPLLWLTSNPQRNVERFFERMASGASEVDQRALASPRLREMLMRSYLEATRAGLRGFAHESIILSTPWGFRIQDIAVPVQLWHGEQDRSVSLSSARHLSKTMSNCEATFLPTEGRWLDLSHWADILARLLGRRSGLASQPPWGCMTTR